MNYRFFRFSASLVGVALLTGSALLVPASNYAGGYTCTGEYSGCHALPDIAGGHHANHGNPHGGPPGQSPNGPPGHGNPPGNGPSAPGGTSSGSGSGTTTTANPAGNVCQVTTDICVLGNECAAGGGFVVSTMGCAQGFVCCRNFDESVRRSIWRK